MNRFILILSCILFTAPAVLQAEPLSEINLDFLKRQEKALQWGRDPFALPDKRSGIGMRVDREFHLSAIIYRSGKGLAIINNKILRKGDKIDGRKIADIREDRVILRDTAGERVLRVDKFVLGRSAR